LGDDALPNPPMTAEDVVMHEKLSRFNVLTAAGAFVMAVWVAACSTAATRTGEVADATEPLEDRVASIVKNELLAKGVPAVSVAVMRDGKMLLERGWGAGDIEKNVAASHTTIYPTGSIAKQFTATLLLEQVERGRLALTDPIGKHLKLAVALLYNSVPRVPGVSDLIPRIVLGRDAQ
jgi:CubicO group peptidase (beta-lactamase class C family)